MNRRDAVAALLALGAAPLRSLAQPPGKVWRVGLLVVTSAADYAPQIEALRQGLRELGYVEGRNLVVERRFADGKPERLPALAAELVRLNVDAIVTGANPVIAAVKQATTTIPVVMATSRDPVGSAFVASLNRPGGNITGMTGDPTPEVQSKRLELLKEAVPRASRAALLWNPSSPGADRYKKMVEDAAIRLGMTLHPVEVRGRDEFEGAFAAMAREGADALVVLPDPLTFTARSQVVALAAKYRLPAVYHAKEVVEVGGLLSYGVSLEYQFRRAAWYVDRILKGARPADLAVDQATTLELAINLKTAKALGLTIPASLRMRADRVIE